MQRVLHLLGQLRKVGLVPISGGQSQASASSWGERMVVEVELNKLQEGHDEG